MQVPLDKSEEFISVTFDKKINWVFYRRVLIITLQPVLVADDALDSVNEWSRVKAVLGKEMDALRGQINVLKIAAGDIVRPEEFGKNKTKNQKQNYESASNSRFMPEKSFPD